MGIRKFMYALFLILACYNPAEYSTVAGSGVVKLRVSDNSVVGTVQGIPEGRALLSTGNTQFLIASGTGELFIINSAEMAVDTSFTVGYPGGAGYRSMIMPVAGTVYISSSVGDILQVDMNELSRYPPVPGREHTRKPYTASLFR